MFSLAAAAGCTKLVLELGASKTRWCVVPKSDGSNRLEHVVCPTHSKDQCFHVDGDLAVGARIRHANNPGLCIGLLLAPPGSWPPAPSMVADAARMLPCSGSDGYVKWRQASPGTASYLQLAAGPACTGASNQPRECRFAVCFVLPYRTSPGPVQVIDTLFVRTVPESHVLSSGRANYKVETHAPGAWGPKCAGAREGQRRARSAQGHRCMLLLRRWGALAMPLAADVPSVRAVLCCSMGFVQDVEKLLAVQLCLQRS